MATFSKVDCCEAIGRRRERMTRSGFEATVVLECAWEDRIALLSDLVMTPRKYPFFNGNAICTEAEPIEIGGRVVKVGQSYDHVESVCQVQAKYQYSSKFNLPEEEIVDPENPPEPRPYTSVQEKFDFAAEFITLDHKDFRWGTRDGEGVLTAGEVLREDQAPGKLQPTRKLVRTLDGWPYIPTEVDSLPGYVNDRPYYSRYHDRMYPAESLLYLGGTADVTFTDIGSKGYSITLNFGIQMNGWNKVYNKLTGQWQEIIQVTTDGGTPVPYKNYPLANMGWLLDISGAATP